MILAIFAQLAQPVTPVIVKVIDAPAQEIAVIDILMGSFGIVGLILFGSALLGLGLGGLFVWYRRRQDANAPEEPPLNPYQLNLHATTPRRQG